MSLSMMNDLINHIYIQNNKETCNKIKLTQ